MRACAALIVAATAAFLAAPATAGTTVKAPDAGSEYTGSPGSVQMILGSRRIDLMAFSFRCSGTRGRTSLNSIALRRTSRGYTFDARQSGGISFRNGRADENGRFHVRGRFSRTARRVRGTFRVRSRRCKTGDVAWSGRLVNAS